MSQSYCLPREDETMDDAIFTRVSVREFTDEALTDDEIEKLMRAAMAAPSAGNQQPWEFFLTRDETIKEKLSTCSHYAKPAAKADVVIIPCTKSTELRFPPCAPLDMSACVENILLEAAALNLGSVWLGVYPEEDRMDAVAEAAGIPGDYSPFALIALGHPTDEIPPRSARRYEPERIHWIEG